MVGSKEENQQERPDRDKPQSHLGDSPRGMVRMWSFWISSMVPIISVLSLARARLHMKKMKNCAGITTAGLQITDNTILIINYLL